MGYNQAIYKTGKIAFCYTVSEKKSIIFEEIEI